MSKERAILYARVSGDDTGSDGANLDSQLAMCRKYAVERGYNILHELAEDVRGVSGSTLDRPQLTRVLDLAREGEFDVLVVRETDRLSRNIGNRAFIEDEIDNCGARVEFVIEAFDDTPEGFLNKNIKGVLADYEWRKIRWRTRNGQRAKAQAGYVTFYGRPPYGYIEANTDGWADGDKGWKRRKLVINPEEAGIVTLIYKLFLEGEGGNAMGVTSIARYLSERRVPTAGDKRAVVREKTIGYGIRSHDSVARILRNTVYRGEWVYGRDWAEPISVPVEPIVSRETWEAVQAKTKANRKVRKYAGDYDFMLRGYAYCPECGRHMRCNSDRKEKRVYFYYRCSCDRKKIGREPACNHTKSYRAKDVDTVLWKYVR